MPMLAQDHPAAPAQWLPTQPHYPTALIDTRVLPGCGRLTLRPVLPQDDHLLAGLVAGLSHASHRQRFQGAVKLSFNHMQQMCHVDFRRQLALVVSLQVDGAERVVADARYHVDADGEAAEFAVMVDERLRRQGLGAWAMDGLQVAARQAGLRWLNGEVLLGNAAMLGLAQRCGYAISPHPEDEGLVRAQQCVGQTESDFLQARKGALAWLRRHVPCRAPASTTR